MVSVNEYLIHNAVRGAKRAYTGTSVRVTHQTIVNYLHGDKLWDALDEYLKAHIHCVEDLDRPLD